MARTARPNFYVLLGLNPDADWDQAHFDEILRARRSEWSRLAAGTTKKALTARQYLTLVEKIVEVMTDPKLREKEAQAGKASLKASQKAGQAQFERQLELINAKDFVMPDEVEKFSAAFQHLLTAEEVQQRITTPIRSAPPPPPQPPVVEVPILEESIARDIQERLNSLNMRHLYELLCRSNKTSTLELQRAAEILYTQTARLASSTESKTRIELTELARRIFQTEQTRAAYDEWLRQDGLTRLFHDLDQAMKRSGRDEIHQKQVLLFLYEARKAGWSVQDALEELKAHARQHHWIIALLPVQQEAEKLLCPNCEKLNEKQRQYCLDCKQPLYVDCPACGKLATCEEAVCGNCGFAVGNRYLVDALLKELQAVLDEGDAEQAKKVVKETELAWSPRGGKGDYRSQLLLALKVQLRHLEAARRQIRRDVLCELTMQELQGEPYIQVSWPLPREGKMLVVRSTHPLNREGEELPEAQLDQLGEFLARGTQVNDALDAWNVGVVIYYTPVILFRHRIHIGTSQRYICVQNVGQLRYHHLGTVLRLAWDWPAQCQEVEIAYHPSYWPPYGDPTAITSRLSRAEYERPGYYEMRDLLQRDYYIVVYALEMFGDEKVRAAGERILVRLMSKTVLTYVIKPPSRQRKGHVLHIALNQVRELPELVLVHKRGGLPLRKTDGDIFCRIAGMMVEGQELAIDLPSSDSVPIHSFGKLFFADDRQYQNFVVHHPSIDQMRLS